MKNPLFPSAKFSLCIKQKVDFYFTENPIGICAASEAYWRLPSSPIVKKDMCVFHVVVVAVVVVIVDVDDEEVERR